MEKMDKKEVLVFIFDGYADWESAFVCAELSTASDYVVKTVGVDKTPVMSMGGFRNRRAGICRQNFRAAGGQG